MAELEVPDVIPVNQLDECPCCGMQWKYYVTCNKCDGEGDGCYCDHLEDPYLKERFPEMVREHNPHCCINGQRGPFGKLVGVEYPYGSEERYDGISEYRCPGCGTRWGRWTGKILEDGEIEKRFGGKR